MNKKLSSFGVCAFFLTFVGLKKGRLLKKMEKKWLLKTCADDESVAKLIQSCEEAGIKLNPHIAKLLVQRKIYTHSDLDLFYNPKLEHLYDPFLMKDMDIAVERIERAMSNKEKILIYGDYDVDGTTAVAAMYSFFKKIGAEPFYYIPDRFTDGYGLCERGIEYAAGREVSLMIVLDCGIKGNKEVEYAKTKGIDMIIADHHRPGDVLPDAYAVLDPKRNDCEYPYKELSGCGVGFKLAQAYAQKHQLNPRQYIYPLLDLVAISIASDIVPITNENRVLSYFGLLLINAKPRPGIEAILEFSKVTHSAGTKNLYFNKELSNNDLVFLVGPRINAAGRIESGRKAVDLLLCASIEEAKEIGELINTFNTERKSLDMQATQEALEVIKEEEKILIRNTSVVYNPQWNKGIIGIVASRLTESYYKPTIVFTESNGMLTGSARSVKGFDIYDAIEACSEYLEHFGGHKYAAGLSIKEENYEAFKKKFEKIVNEQLSGNKLEPEIEIDADLDLSDIHLDFFRELKRFAPFGPGNMNPIFASKRLKDTGTTRIVGNNNHLKVGMFQPESSSFPINGIAFQQGEHYENIKSGKRFSICYHIEENQWNGNTKIQLNIKDIKIE